LDVDFKDLYTSLYGLIPGLFVSSSAENMSLIFTCLEDLFSQKFQIALDRAAAFIKRLLVCSLSSSPNVIVACILFAKKMFKVEIVKEIINNYAAIFQARSND
jgi:hypothetical protein